MIIYGSCKYWHVPEQIAEKPTEQGLEFVAVALSLAQGASKLSPKWPFARYKISRFFCLWSNVE